MKDNVPFFLPHNGMEEKLLAIHMEIFKAMSGYEKQYNIRSFVFIFLLKYFILLKKSCT